MKLKTLLSILLTALILLIGISSVPLCQQSKPTTELNLTIRTASDSVPTSTPGKEDSFTIRPKLIGSGDDVTIVGGWPNQSEYKIYVANDNERYLVGKAGFNGGMMWNGVVEKTLKTLDGKEVNLTQDDYHFVIDTDSNHWEGGEINLVSDSVPIPDGAEIRMPAAMQVQVGVDLLSLRLNRLKDKLVTPSLQLKNFKIDSNDVHLISGIFSPLVFQIRYSVLPSIPTSDWNIHPSAQNGWVSEVTYMTVIADNGQFKINGISEYPPSQTQFEMFTPSITSDQTDLDLIAKELMKANFKHYTVGSIPEDQRLLSYKLNQIRIISQSAYGFMFYLDFSVQGASEATSWYAGNGSGKGNGFVEGKVWFVRVAKQGNAYKMIGAGTSP